MLIYITPEDLCKLGFFTGTAVTSLIAVLVLLILKRK